MPLTGVLERNEAVLCDRYYDPSTAQFLSVDPDVQQTGQPYEFADGDPVNNSDPSGSITCAGWFSWVPGCGVITSLQNQASAAFRWANQQTTAFECGDLGFANGVFAGVLGCAPGQIDQDHQLLIGLSNELRGLQNQLEAHQAKLRAYENDPLSYDNKGFLRQALEEGGLNRAISIYESRIQSLQRQIDNFQRQIDESELGDVGDDG